MIEALLILILGAGFFFISFDRMRELYSYFFQKIQKWSLGFKYDVRDKEKNHDKYWNHFKQLLKLSLGLGSDRSVVWFVSISTLLGSIVMTLLSGWVSTRLTIIASLIFFVLPYFILRIILQNIRVKSSREGELLLGELSDNYKINYYNMQRAIEITSNNIENAPKTKRLLLTLSRGLNRVGSPEEIRHLLDEFRMSINTSWATILANNMYFSLTQGIRVDLALDDLQDTISRARKLDEYQKRQNNESKLVLRYLAPISYLLTIFGAVKFFNLSFEKFLFYQFRTEAGLSWITISIICYVVAIFSERFIANTKLDF